MTISILRQHYQYEMVTSQIYRTSIISTIKHDNTREELFFIPVHNMLEDLEIKDSSGRHLAVLSKKEVRSRFGVDLDNLNLRESEPNKTLELIPILLLPSDSPYEKIFFTYTEPIKPDRYEKTMFSPSMNINFRFKIIPSEFLVVEKYKVDKKPFDLHILFKSGDDYKTNKSVRINIYPDKDDKIIHQKQITDGNVGYFVPEVDFDDVIIGSIEVGLTDSLLKTAKTITAVGIALPTILLLTPILSGKLFEPTLELLGLSIALLIGERIWVLKDKYVMQRWVKMQNCILLFNGLAFVLWIAMWGTDIWWMR